MSAEPLSTGFPEVDEYTGEQVNQVEGVEAEDDSDLLKRIDYFIDAHRSDYEKLQGIAKRNREYWRGNQINESELYVGENAIVDNRIFTSVETVVPIVTRKTPEPDVTAYSPKTNPIQTQEKIELELKALWEIELNMQTALEESVRNLFASRYGMIKVFYDEDEKKIGRKVIPMGKVLFNYKAESIDDTPIVEYVTCTLKELKEKFPEKKEEIAQAAGIEITDSQSSIEYIEYWDNEYYVCRYKTVVLYKEANPFWNWEEIENEGEEDPVENPYTFNHFSRPRKPYILLNQFTWGDSLVDDITLIEQNLTLQDSVNRRKAITEQNAGMANGKMIFAGQKIDREDVDDIDNSPQQKIYLTNAEDARGAMTMEYGRPLDQGLFTDMQDSKAEIDNIMGTHATTRGEQVQQETATGRALLKDSDAGRIEILTRRIEKFAQEFYNWCVQLMYVYYDEQHPVHYMSSKNDTSNLTAKEKQIYIQRDEFKDLKFRILVQNGSTVPRDKTTQKAEAVELAKLGLMSKKDMYRILEYPDPDMLARNAYLEQTAPQMLYEAATGDTWDIEAIRHIHAIVDNENPDAEPIDIYSVQDPNMYQRHITTHAEYIKGTEVDPDLPPFEELDLDTKEKVVDHFQMELTQAEELINQMQSNLGSTGDDPLLAALLGGETPQAPVDGGQPAIEGSGQIAADVLAGAQPSPPAQLQPPLPMM